MGNERRQQLHATAAHEWRGHPQRWRYHHTRLRIGVGHQEPNAQRVRPPVNLGFVLDWSGMKWLATLTQLLETLRTSAPINVFLR